MTPSKYVSVMKIGGHPLLPPIIADSERAALRKHREDAMKVEAKLVERARRRRPTVEHEGGEKGAAGLNDSSFSLVDTQQIMDLIRHAFKDSHSEEVQHFQDVLYEELRKYGGEPLRRADSLDTLANVEELSVAAGSDVSPIKFTSPSKSSDLPNLVGPSVHLNCPKFVERASQPSNIPVSPRTPDKITPPRLIRRKSYTLESPSPSVIEYLKSLQTPEDISDSTYSTEKNVQSNLNTLWSELLSTSQDSSQMSRSEPAPPRRPSPVTTNQSKVRRNLYDKELDNNPQTWATKTYVTKENNTNQPRYIELAAAKIQAGVRGYLTRRLLRTQRVIELKNAIRDSLVTALQMHGESTINKADIELHRKLTFQIESLCDEWHQIFFEFTSQERMKIIEVDRNKVKNPKPKRPFLRKSRSRVSMEASTSSVSLPVSTAASRPKSLPLRKPITSK